MNKWHYYPDSESPPGHIIEIVNVFKRNSQRIDSSIYKLSSNEVLSIVRDDLVKNGFMVEKGKKATEKIKMAVQFGTDGQFFKYFHVDALQRVTGTVLEVEAGRAVDNHQFLKDLFESCIMQEVNYLAIAVRTIYRNQSDFDSVKTHFDALYASSKLKLPLKGILIIGY